VEKCKDSGVVSKNFSGEYEYQSPLGYQPFDNNLWFFTSTIEEMKTISVCT
jgi:hypothetical protein